MFIPKQDYSKHVGPFQVINWLCLPCRIGSGLFLVFQVLELINGIYNANEYLLRNEKTWAMVVMIVGRSLGRCAVGMLGICGGWRDRIGMNSSKNAKAVIQHHRLQLITKLRLIARAQRRHHNSLHLPTSCATFRLQAR